MTNEGLPGGQRAIRRRLVRAAGDTFTRQGYRATTTKQVAQLAETTERTLFRHYGTKAGLFEATVVEPFSDFIDAWVTSFSALEADAPLEAKLEDWVAGLVVFLEENEPLLRILIGGAFERDPDIGPIAERIAQQFAAGLLKLAEEAGIGLLVDRHYAVEDPPVALAGAVSMALGTTLLADWVFLPDRRPERGRLVSEITQMILHGIERHRPPEH